MSTHEEIELDHTPLTFGKYKGQTPDEVSEHDPAYIVWMYRNVTNKPTCSKFLVECCEADSWRDKTEDDTDELY